MATLKLLTCLAVIIALFLWATPLAWAENVSTDSSQPTASSTSAAPASNGTEDSSNKLSPDARKCVEGNSAFACDLYQRLAGDSPGKNLFFSPCGISTALALAYGGARGQTETQMARVLHFNLPQDKLHPAVGELLKAVISKDEPKKEEPGFYKDRDGHLHPVITIIAIGDDREIYRLRIANALWLQKEAALEPSFEKILPNYGVEPLQHVDFMGDLEKARKAIDAWAARRTEGRITKLASPSMPNADTRLVITNAVFFQSRWEHKFQNTETRDEPFTLESSDGKAPTVIVPLMRQTAQMAYYEDESVQVVELYYYGDRNSMLIVLPNPGVKLAAVERTLTPGQISAWRDKMLGRKVNLFLPRFKIDNSFSLRGKLSAMGLTDAFSKDADFTGLVKKESTPLQDVIHQATVEVDEEGTVAAALSVLVFGGIAANRPPPPPATFRADHPFLFAIRHNETGAILFLGRVMDPR